MILAVLLAAAGTAWPPSVPRHVDGRLADGAAYTIDVPNSWNGTLLVWSHGYAPAPPPPEDAPRGMKEWLLKNGYALAGSSYAEGGWALEQAVPDQVATIAAFGRQIAPPRRTIAWGQSMGGLVTVAIAERNPDAITAALPMCGSLAGAVGMMNEALAGAFAFRTLLAPHADIQLVRVTDDGANSARVNAAVASAMRSAGGRARLALAATLGQLPHWTDPASPEPEPTDYEQAIAQQAKSFAMGIFLPRSDQERRAGGVFSSTEGVDFSDLLNRSGERTYVEEMYRRAGLSLEKDLNALTAAPPVRADPGAVRYMAANYSPSGSLRVPMLAVHTSGDGLTAPNNLTAYASAVAARGASEQLREIAVAGAGHCAFSPAEIAASLKGLEHRLDSGRWDVDPAALTRGAAANGLGPVRFAAAHFAPFLRPYVTPAGAR